MHLFKNSKIHRENQQQRRWLGLIFILLAVVQMSVAQVGINTIGAEPDGSAMLDVSSTDKGILIPRMDSTARQSISDPATSLLVYDSTTISFWFYDGDDWTELMAGQLTEIADTDGDTKITVEASEDEDVLRFTADSTEVLFVKENMTRLNTDLFIDFEGYSTTSELSVNYTNDGDYFAYGSTDPGWQSFTAEDNGEVDSIEILFVSSPPDRTYNFVLYEGEGDTGQQLGTGSISSPTGSTWENIDFSGQGIILEEGKKYTLWSDSRERWGFENNDLYPGGRSSVVIANDFLLRVYLSKEEYAFSVEDGTVTATAFVGDGSQLTNTGTDNQVVDELILTDDILSISLEDDGQDASTVDLSPLFDRTNQTLSDDLFVGFEGYATSSELSVNYSIQGSFFTWNNSIPSWQSFTAEDNGKIDYVAIYLSNPVATEYNFILYEGEGTAGQQLATGIITSATINSWNAIDFSGQEVILNKGQLYTLWVDNRYKWGFEEEDLYPGGRAGFDEDSDHLIRVYVFKEDYTFSVEDGMVDAGNVNEDIAALQTDVTDLQNDLQQSAPTGTIQMWPTSTAPTGWLICDGSSFSSSTYPDLASVLGSTSLPNFAGRFPLGVGNSGTSGATSHSLSSTGGEETHVLTIAEMPAHSHNITYADRSKDGNGNDVSDLSGSGSSSSTASAGGSQPHNNMPPFYTINFIIKAE